MGDAVTVSTIALARRRESFANAASFAACHACFRDDKDINWSSFRKTLPIAIVDVGNDVIVHAIH